MSNDTQSLLKEYEKNKDTKLILKILENYGFKSKNIDNIKDLSLSYQDDKIEVQNKDSLYCIDFQVDKNTLITNHVFIEYQIEKEYLKNDLEHPISKSITIILSDSERIIYRDEIKGNIRKRTLKKIVNYNGIDNEIYVKEFSCLINNPSICQIVTINRDKEDNGIFNFQKNVDLNSCFKHFSDKRIGKNNIVISEFIEKGNSRYKENNRNILDINFDDIDIPTIIIRIQKDYYRKNISIIKDNDKMVIIIQKYIADLKSEIRKTIPTTNTNSTLTIEDLDILIDFFSNIKEKDLVVINELKHIKIALARNIMYKKGISDEIDIYFDNPCNDSFERFSADLNFNIVEINNKIESGLSSKSEKIKLELKDPQTKQ